MKTSTQFDHSILSMISKKENVERILPTKVQIIQYAALPGSCSIEETLKLCRVAGHLTSGKTEKGRKIL